MTFAEQLVGLTSRQSEECHAVTNPVACQSLLAELRILVSNPERREFLLHVSQFIPAIILDLSEKPQGSAVLVKQFGKAI